MTAVQPKSGLSPAARYLILSACFVIIVAGIRSAEPIVVPFLLSVFIAVICTSPLFWLKRKGVPTGIAVMIVLVGIILFLCLVIALLISFVKDLANPSQRKDSGSGSGGGVIGALGVLDRIVNPAGAHVEQAKEVEQEEQGVGGE